MQSSNKPLGVSLHYLCLWASVVFVTLTLSMALPQSSLAASPITGVTVSPATAGIHSGQAVFLRATVEGTGDIDHRVNWSLNPGNAGSVSPTGLFISAPGFTGAATVTATSVESPAFSGAAAITVSEGGGVVHVDRNNLVPGAEDGTALHPYRTIQGAINNAGSGDTIKVAQGTYSESVGMPWLFGVLLLGGFQGGSAEDYAANRPGDFRHPEYGSRYPGHHHPESRPQHPAGGGPGELVPAQCPDLCGGRLYPDRRFQWHQGCR